uniref:Uncharacterized protein n=1 Tax=Anopheles albimanus TaxID=7167 RepID=A0A182FWK6_ANOAL
MKSIDRNKSHSTRKSSIGPRIPIGTIKVPLVVRAIFCPLSLARVWYF